jgi:predicted glycosyltransferase involved in capsule biosynthesis
MQRTLRDWPIVLNAGRASELDQPVQVSFIIGHRGRARVPHLLATLRSIAAQRNVTFECVVVEQSNEPEVENLMPPWVRYVHTPLRWADMPYSRSWAFNVGADLAHGNLLILHDNDMLVPQDYASQMLARRKEGHEVINVKRFVFYLAKEHSEKIMISEAVLLDNVPESVVQNLEAGGSFGISRDAYLAIGGFDESFVGWGGEDNEFWERAQTRKVWPHGYLPVLHLWHENHPHKVLGEDAPAKRKYWELSSIPAGERIRNLLQRQTA